MGELMKDLFDLTNRQKAEIERLKAKNLDLEFELKAMQHAANLLKKKSEVMKERF
jgi:FtsZ-binding cell division protein ZapB